MASLLSMCSQSLEQPDTGRSECIISQFIQKPPGEKEIKEDGLLHGLTTGPLVLWLLGSPTLDLGIPGLPPLSSSHIPSLPPLPPSFPFPRGPTPKPARGSGGALQCGLRQGPSRQMIWYISEPKGAALVATAFVHFH